MSLLATLPLDAVRLFHVIREHGLDTVPRIRLLMNWVELDPADQMIIAELREAANSEIVRQQSTPDPFRKTAPRDEAQFCGQLNLGVIPHHGYLYQSNIESIKRHWFVGGRTGGGKTTVILGALMQVFQQPNAPKILILERKQEYTELLSVDPQMHVLDSKHLAFNPLLPPAGINLAQWIGIFTECMVNYLDIREASSSFIMDHALRLIKNMGKEGRYPTLGDLRSFIVQQPYKPFSKNGQQKETVLNRLNDLLNSLPAMFDSSRQTRLEELLKNHCCILLHDITHSTIQNFVISLLIAQVFLLRKIQHGLQESLKNIIVLDEAATLFRRKDELKDHASFINDVVKTARGYGVGIIAASQVTTDLSHALLANTGTRMMVGGFGRTEDIDVFLRLRGCNQEQRQYVVTHPDVGKAFVADERWPHIIECNLHLPRVPGRLLGKALQDRIEQSAQMLTAKVRSHTPAERVEEPAKIAPAANKPASIETRVLLHIYHNHFMRLCDRAKALDIPSATLRKEIIALESGGHIKIYKVHGKAGAPRDLYEVTPGGCKKITQPEKNLKGKGSYLHQFYQQQVAEHFKSKDYRTDIEGVANGKNIDLIVRKKPEGECVAIEIELNSKANLDHVIENFERAAQAEFIDRVMILVPTEAERKASEKCVTQSLYMRKPILVERLWKYLES